LDFSSGDTSPKIKASSCDGMNGFGKKCHPSFSTSIPCWNPDINKTLIVARSFVMIMIAPFFLWPKN
jgi:hypothetical protein